MPTPETLPPLPIAPKGKPLPGKTPEERFKDEYGIDPGSANVLFSSNTHLKEMLEFMYYDAMEALRECNLREDGDNLQGKAQTLWTLLNIPNEVKNLQNSD
jgi:hypothetical protein